MADDASVKRSWKKILYEDQGVPDNYVDESFLDEMKKNLYTRNYNYWTVVRNSGQVTQQIASQCLFVFAFIFMDEHKLQPLHLCLIMAALVSCGYLLKLYSDSKPALSGKPKKIRSRTLVDDMKTLMLFTCFSFALSPVLVSLTETISTDTIYAMTAIMLLANLVFHDYGANVAMVSEALSLNAGIFASVCLASRLMTIWHAFATVTLAVMVFGLWPLLRRDIKETFGGGDVILTVTCCSLSVTGMLSVSYAGSVMVLLLYIFITFICPAWLISLQPYKNNIYGPWDEAIIHVK